jgi:hypothetical protein
MRPEVRLSSLRPYGLHPFFEHFFEKRVLSIFESLAAQGLAGYDGLLRI